jgi:pSer/pThr/pTyr-binding forkhead associated (FHA) protein
MIKLVLKDSKGREAQFPLTSELIIGRDENCDIALADPRISRRHARVYLEGRQAVIEDLGSRNGTFVNRKQIVEPQRLNRGDLITVGKFKLQLVETNPLMDYVAPTQVVSAEDLDRLTEPADPEKDPHQ